MISESLLKTVLHFLDRYSYVNWALADQALVSGVNFLTGIMLARFLGPEKFGLYTLAWMVVLFFYNLQFVLIISPMTTIGPQHTATKVSAYYSSVLLQQVIFACITSVLIFVGGYFLGISSSQMTKISHLSIHLAVAAFFFQFQMFLRFYFFSREQPIVAFIIDLVSYLGQVILLYWFLQTQRLEDTKMILWIVSGTSLLAILIGIPFLGKLSLETKTFFFALARNWTYSKWLFLSTLFQWVSGNSFIVAAGTILGTTAVGALKASQNVVGITHIILQGLNSIVPSQASKHLVSSGKFQMETYLKKTFLYGSALAVIILVPIGLFPKFFLRIFYGSNFVEYGWVIQWYVIIYVLMFLALPFRYGLRTLETTKPIFIGYVLSGLSGLILSSPMVRRFGLLGVMIGLIFMTLIQFLSLSIAYSRIRKIVK